ncbi:aldo/keto reductase, partial [Crocosphaera watsonii]
YLFEEMLQLKQKNLIRKIGVSVYNADQIDQVLSRYSIDLIQLPINIFDQRLLKNGYLEKLHNLGIEIHARSLFLQGLLLMNLEELPPYFTPYRTCLETYYKTLDKNGISPLKSALDFIQNISQVNCIIVGINTAEQLQEILGTFNETERLNSDFFESFSIENELIINPSNWVI